MKLKRILITTLIIGFVGCCFYSCEDHQAPKATTGVKKATAEVATNAKGLTAEQENIKNRYAEDNKPGSIKHLYVISAMSGQTIIYSTVKGKVTSSGKRLSPYKVVGTDGQHVDRYSRGFKVNFAGTARYTSEVLQDDGTYGSSIPYLFWWDTKGAYHKHYVSGGQILHVSNKPMKVKSIMINISK